MFLIFLKCAKIASVGLKLDRPQLQHWLLFLDHNWPTPKSENSNVVGLPVKSVPSNLSHLVTMYVERAMFTHFLVEHR